MVDNFPLNYNFAVAEGDTFTQLITWTTGPAENSQTPVDLTGFTGQFVVEDEDGEPIIDLTAPPGITLGGVDGTIQIAAQTQGILPGCYHYWLTLTAGDIITTLLTGSFNIEAK